MKFKINLKLLPMKGHYLLFNAATAPVLPFIPVVARQLGFSATIVGVVYTIIPICGMLGKPLAGALADKYHIMKFLFVLFEVLTALGLVPIFFIPPLPSEANVRVSCQNGMVRIDTSTKNFTEIPKNFLSKLRRRKDTLTCDIRCPSDVNDDTRFIATKEIEVTVNVDEITESDNMISFSTDGAVIKVSREKIKCEDDRMFVCTIVCDSSMVNNYLETRKKNQLKDMIKYYQFWIFLIMMIISWTSNCIVCNISDAVCFELLDDPSKYGQQRVWGSFGWGTFATLSGILVDALSTNEYKKNYTVVCVLLIVMISLDVFSTIKIKYVQPEKAPSITKDITKLLPNIPIVIFMLWCVLVGMCTAIFWNYLFWLVEDLAENNPDTLFNLKTIDGLILTVRCFLGEIPFFYISGLIMKRIGYVACMSFVLLIDGIRLLLYTIVPNPWLILPIEMLNGISFGLFYATMVSYASVISPTGTEATIQGLVGALFEGVGVSLGSCFGGILLDKYGSKKMFMIFGVSALVCSVTHTVVQYILKMVFKLPTVNLSTRTSPSQE